MHAKTSVRLLAAAGAVALGALSLPATRATTAVAATPATPHFVVAPLPNPAGVPTPRNEDVEPGIGIDGGGTIWIGSNIDPNTSGDPRVSSPVGLLSGEDFWKSTDGGRTFQWVSDPYGLNGPSSFGLGGEDSDATAAPEKNSSGFYNVYGTSLWLGASSLAWSQDGGQTFQLFQLGGIPAQDRPWLSADGPCTLYLTYHQLPLFLPVVNTYDMCSGPSVVQTPTPTIDPVSQTQLFTQNSLPGATNAFNKPMVDTWPSSPHRHNIYVPMEACNLQSPMDFLNNVETTAEMLPTCPSGVDTQVEVAVSSDNGASFTTNVVGMNTNGEQQVWPTSLAVGPDGSVYVAWSDNTDAYTSVSHDGGTTWTATHKVNAAPVGTADYPTIAVGPDGHVDIVYYGSTTRGKTNDSNAMGKPGDPTAAPWRLYLSRSYDGGASFRQQAISWVLHTGVLCTQGSACAGGGARNLYDDFGVAVSRTTGLTTIAFDSDQPPTGAPADKAVDPYTAYATELPATGSTANPAPTPGSSPASSAGGVQGASAANAIPNTSAIATTGRGSGAAAAAALLLLLVAARGGRRRFTRRR